jgi:hypothetical protein
LAHFNSVPMLSAPHGHDITPVCLRATLAL